MDYFTGDGTSTTFTLSYTPASATSILVYISGVKQVASTTNPAYYLIGNQLILSAAPAANSPIEVNYLGIASQVNVPSSQSITQSMLSLQIANTFVTNTITNGTQNVITLVAPPVSSNSLIVTANGVVQYDYYVNGSNLYLNFTPPAGTRIRAQGIALTTVGVPNDASITSAKLSSNLTFTGTSTFAANVVIAGNLSVAGNTTYVNSEVANNGLYSTGAFLGSYTSGIVMDYSGSTGRISVGSGAGLTFYNGGVGSSALMTLNSSGYLGVGTTNPDSLLNVAGTLKSSSTSTVGYNGVWMDFSSPNGRIASINSSGAPASNLKLATTNISGVTTVAMHIDYNQNVGIGTISPNTAVTIQGTDNNTYGQLQVISTGNDARIELWNSAGNTTTGRGSIFMSQSSGYQGMRFMVGGADKMILSNNGYLGINTTSPSFPLDVYGSGGAAIRGGQGFNLYNSDNTNNYYMYNAGSSGSGNATLLFVQGGVSERMRIDSSGNVGIGTSSLSDKFTVLGNIRTTDGTNYAQFVNNYIRSYASGTFYFDNYTVGQSFVTRVSNASALDTTAVTIAPTGTMQLNAAAGNILNSNGRPMVKQTGGVLQTLTVFDNTQYTFNSGSASQTTYYSISGLTVTITPSSTSSKILLIGSVSTGQYNNGYNNYLRFYRNSTAVGIGNGTGYNAGTTGSYRANDGSAMGTIAMSFLDSPATTSAITYSIQICNSGGSSYPSYINRCANSNTGWEQSGASNFIVMEIAQ